MPAEYIPGLGWGDYKDFLELNTGGHGLFSVGNEGVKRILTPADKKVEFIIYDKRTTAYVHSALGYPAMYPMEEVSFEGPAEAVLMDLDGTSVRSETFWMWIIEQTIARLMGKEDFELEFVDEPHVSGHSVPEHLKYCIRKYCPEKSFEDARKFYHEITRYEMNEITTGRGRKEAFRPCAGLKEFLLTLKEHHVRIGLVTSGLYEKAWPEILSAFKTLDMGDPLDFYDCIITAGQAMRKGQVGTIGELAPKPHPWLYAETARFGLGIDPSKKNRVIGIEDSSAGVLSLRLAGFSVIGVTGGNIAASGVRPLLKTEITNLMDAVPLICGKIRE